MAAVKTGMLATGAIIELVARRAAAGDLPNLVVDPVMVASSGDRLLDADAELAYLERLFPYALVVTPNLREASLLVGRELSDVDDMAKAAVELAATGARSCWSRAATSPATLSTFSSTANRSTNWRSRRVVTANVHGTGCTHGGHHRGPSGTGRHCRRRRAGGQGLRRLGHRRGGELAARAPATGRSTISAGRNATDDRCWTTGGRGHALGIEPVPASLRRLRAVDIGVLWGDLSIAIIQHRAVLETQRVNEQLTGALESRVVIEQAKGVIVERAGVDLAEAFSRLRRYARNHNLRLTDAAQASIDGTLDPAAWTPAAPPARP